MFCRVFTFLICAFAGSAANAGPATRAVGPVTELLATGDPRAPAFRDELAGKYSGVPDQAAFVAGERWVSILASTTFRRWDIVKGRASSHGDLALGDIVEMRYADHKQVKAYDELPEVIAVRCRKAQPDYASCAAANPVGLYDASGQVLNKGPR